MPSHHQYERLPTSDPREHEHDVDVDPEYEAAEQAALYANRFNPPPPATWKRAALIFFVIGLFIIAWKMRVVPRPPEIVHADRYSKKYKYRPAASPVITEKLKDGRLLVRGAFRNEL